MGKFAYDDEEYDEARDPRPSLIKVHDLVPEDTDNQSSDSDYQNSSPAWEARVDGMEKLRAYDNIDR